MRHVMLQPFVCDIVTLGHLVHVLEGVGVVANRQQADRAICPQAVHVPLRQAVLQPMQEHHRLSHECEGCSRDEGGLWAGGGGGATQGAGPGASGTRPVRAVVSGV